MTQISQALLNPVPLVDPVPPHVSDLRNPGCIAAVVAATACFLVTAAALSPPVFADGINPDYAPAMQDERSIEYEVTDKDDGSSALGGISKAYELEDVQPISAEEEEGLLGNWGDINAEDGD